MITAGLGLGLRLGRETRKCKLDGEFWPCDNKGDILIPPGEHTLTFNRAAGGLLDTQPLETRLISISGELLGCQARGEGLESFARAVLGRTVADLGMRKVRPR